MKEEGWQTFCNLFTYSNTLFMELLYTSNSIGDYANELTFIMGVIITIAFYIQYKKCNAEIEREEMLEHFLND
jgi:hypothetical protein